MRVSPSAFLLKVEFSVCLKAAIGEDLSQDRC